MNREIKFRAWDKDNDEWFTPFHIDEDGRVLEDHGGGLSVYGEPYGGQGRVELMQYTGLIDMNHREVYEGDILKVTNPLTGKYVIRSVWWNGESARFNGLPYGESSRVMEVIGNIYENPELIKENK